MNRVASGVIAVALLLSLFASIFSIQPAGAEPPSIADMLFIETHAVDDQIVISPNSTEGIVGDSLMWHVNLDVGSILPFATHIKVSVGTDPAKCKNPWGTSSSRESPMIPFPQNIQGSYWNPAEPTNTSGSFSHNVSVYYEIDPEIFIELWKGSGTIMLKRVIYVPNDFTTIQEAINAASSGDTVFVRSGTYHEHVVVNKSISLIGETENTTFVDGDFTGNVLNVTTSSVTVSGFTIQKSGLNESNSGVYISERLADINVSHNVIKENYVGILVFNSTGCTIAGNSVFSNYDDGIRLKLCTDIVVSGNIVSSNRYYGIVLLDSNWNVVLDNSVSNNTYGFCAHRNSDNNIVSKNSFLSSSYSAIGVYWYSDNNTVSGNTVNGSLIGIDVDWVSINNSFLDNTVSNNANGMWLSRSSGNLFLHNSFTANTQKAYLFNSTNIFDNGFEGNYWSDYYGVDSDGDGVGDAPYVIDSNDTDHCPLMNPYWNPADINHDLKVDLKDVYTTAKAYGSVLGDPKWNPHCDIIADAIIDLKDYYAVCKSFGQFYNGS